jgi:hypothetical protein
MKFHALLYLTANRLPRDIVVVNAVHGIVGIQAFLTSRFVPENVPQYGKNDH